MVFISLLLACGSLGPGDSGLGGWNGGQTGSESACSDEEFTVIGNTEDPGDTLAVLGTWNLTWTWHEDYSTEPMTLTVASVGDLFAVSSEECGDRQEFEGQIGFELESGAFDENFSATIEKDLEAQTPVYQVWADLDVQGTYGGEVSFYAAFPDFGPTGTVTDEELIGRW